MVPMNAHGKQLSPDEWVDIFTSCPNEVSLFSITGGEPSLYPIEEVMAEVPWPFSVDSNLRNSPEKWLPTETLRKQCEIINPSLQFHPEHPEAVVFWEHVRWCRENVPHAAMTVTHVAYWRDLEEQWATAKRMCEELGVGFYLGMFDDSFMWPHGRVPLQPYRVSTCSAGHDFCVVCPDSTVYRCVGHMYRMYEPLGKLIDDGWGILHKQPYGCGLTTCTSCDVVEKIILPENDNEPFL
jgi:hypothetical protein